MISVFQIGFIPGFMVGIEWDYINKFLVIDLGIIRLVWDYYPYREAMEEDEE